MKQIPLTQGKFALVDDEDYEQLMTHKWCAIRNGNKWYAVSARLKRQRGMHNQILGPPPARKPMVDHINGDGLDNTRLNLRFCTNRQNQDNVGLHRFNSSGYRGVSWSNNKQYKKRWYVAIRVNGKSKYVGRAATPEEGNKMYQAARKKHGYR